MNQPEVTMNIFSLELNSHKNCYLLMNLLDVTINIFSREMKYFTQMLPS